MLFYQTVDIGDKFALFQIGGLSVQILNIRDLCRQKKPDFVIELPIMKPLFESLIVSLNLLPIFFHICFAPARQLCIEKAKCGIRGSVVGVVYQVKYEFNAVVTYLPITKEIP